MKYTVQFKIYENKITILKIFNKNKPKEDGCKVDDFAR